MTESECRDKPGLSAAPEEACRDRPCLPVAPAPAQPQAFPRGGRRPEGPDAGTSEDARPSHYVYLVRCRDGSYYCGYSTDPVRRAQVHNSGKGAKYTRSRLPVELVYTEACPTKEAALSREWHLKRLSHREKEALVRRSAP